MMRQLGDVGKEKEKIPVRNMKFKSLQVEGVQRARELPVSQLLTKEKEVKKEKKKGKVVELVH